MENTELLAKHLCNVASSLTKSDHIYNLIRTNLLNKCQVKCQFNFKLPVKYFGPDVRCGFCCTEWRENFSVKFEKKKKFNKSNRRKLKLIAENRNGSRTEKQIEHAKNVMNGRYMVIKCFHCGRSTRCRVDGRASAAPRPGTPRPAAQGSGTPRPAAQGSGTPRPTTPQKPPLPSSDRRKRQRDRFAGLSRAACASSTPAKNSNNPLLLLMKARTRDQ